MKKNHYKIGAAMILLLASCIFFSFKNAPAESKGMVIVRVFDSGSGGTGLSGNDETPKIWIIDENQTVSSVLLTNFSTRHIEENFKIIYKTLNDQKAKGYRITHETQIKYGSYNVTEYIFEKE